MTVSRRMMMTGLGSAAGLLAARQAIGTESDAVRVTDFRQAGDVDDTDAFRRAFATRRPVYAPAGKGSGAGGRYLVGATGDDNLPSRAVLFGDGPGRTIIARTYAQPVSFIFHADSKSPDPAKNLAGLRFRDLTFEDEVATRGFSEFNYLVMLSGVTNVRFDRVAFVGFRGDGLHLGSSAISEVERHNIDVAVRNCIFDGINFNNRNAISVIDCTALLVEQCRFLNCSRPGNGTPGKGDPMDPLTGPAMPGAIDCEPDQNRFAIVRDIIIRQNYFEGGGGNAISLNLLPNDKVDIAQQGFHVSGNRIANRAGAFSIFGYGPGVDLAATPSYDVTVTGNDIRGCTTPFIIDGVRGVRVADNDVLDCTGTAEIGYRGSTHSVEVVRNRFERVGSAGSGHGLWVRSSDLLTLAENDFVDCGRAKTRDGIAIAFVDGVSRRLTLSGNRFTSPTGRMARPATVFAAARIDAPTARISDNSIAFQSAPWPELLRLKS